MCFCVSRFVTCARNYDWKNAIVKATFELKSSHVCESAVIDARLMAREVCDVNFGASSQAGSLLAEVSLCLVVRDLCQTRQTETSAGRELSR